MLTPRSRRLLLIGCSALAVLTPLAATAELVVRSQLYTALDSLGDGLPGGVEVSSADGLALWGGR